MTQPTSLQRATAGERRAGRWIPAAAALVFLLFLSAAVAGTIRSNSIQEDLAYRARASSAVAALDDRLVAYEEVLYGVRNGFGVDAELDHDGFRGLVVDSRVRERLAGVQVIGAAHVVDPGRLTERTRAVDASTSRSGLAYPEFDVYPEPGDEPLLPIDFIVPIDGNEAAFGLDFFSEPNRRTAAERARDTGETAMTAPITLVQETGDQRAVLVMLAVYRPGSELSTVEQRRAAFDGVVYAAFRMGDLVDGALGDVEPGDVTIFDTESGETLFGNDAVDASRDGDARVDGLEVSGREWRVVLADDQQVLSAIERSFPYATALAGIALAGLIVALIASMRSARSRAFGLATEMSGELSALTESASEGIITVDGDGRIVSWNDWATNIFRAAADDVIGSHIHDLVPERDRELFDRAFDAAITGGDPGLIARQIRTTGLRLDGEEFPAEMSLSKWSVRDRDFITGFVRDITDRVEAEERLTDITDMLLGVLGAATEIAIVATDVDGTITVFNAGAERMLGYAASDIVEVRTLDWFHDPVDILDRSEQLSMEPGFGVLAASARRGEPETRQWTYITADGHRLPVELTVTPRYDAEGGITGFIGVAIDITERLASSQQQQLLLEQEREMVAKLTELDRVKNDFVSTMSHELRTPLTSIIGFAELLADGASWPPEDPRTSMVDMIDKNAQRLLLLVEDLLALSKIESGSLHANRAACDVGRIITSSQQSIAPFAAKNDIDVRLHLDSMPSIDADAPQLERVFMNLLTNAVKFSTPGSSVDVTASASDDGSGVTITVADHGIGIAEDERQHLFSRFFRSRLAEKNAIQGTGLGLSIVANIVHRHGGSVEVDSTEGVGTTVTVQLPFDGTGAGSGQPEDSAPQEALV